MFRQDILFGSFTIPGWNNLFFRPLYIEDGAVGAFLVIIAYLISAKDRTGKWVKLLEWKQTYTKISWDVVMLLGGGFAMGNVILYIVIVQVMLSRTLVSLLILASY